MGGAFGRVPRRSVLPLAVLALALVVTGCGGRTTPSSVHAGGVSAETYTAIVRALDAGGITVTSESSVRMTYGADRDNVTVTGGGMQTKRTGRKAPATVATVQMRRVGGKWQVASVSGQY